MRMGYRYVSEGVVEAAIVGVSTSISDPLVSLPYHSYGMLCPDGVTRPFDEWGKKDVLTNENHEGTINTTTFCTTIIY